MAQFTLLDPGGPATLPLPLLHTHQHDAQVSTDRTGHESSRAETLRHSIVEMAGRAGLVGQEQRQVGNTRIYHLGQLDSSRHIRQHLSDIEASNKHRITLITRRHDRIDLDISKTQRQNGQVQHDVALQPSHATTHQPHPPSTYVNPKDRASAWLLKRFRKRHEKSAGQKRNSHEVANESQQDKEQVPEPIKKPSMAPGSGKRSGVTKADYSHMLSTTVKKEEPCFQPHPPATQPLSNSVRDNAHTTNQHRDNESPVEHRSSLAKELKSIYEVRGKAIQPPPAKEQSSARPTGLFSASLEAFKRRLKISSNKHSQRLYGDELDGTESYLITADSRNLHQEATRPQTVMSKVHHNGRQYSAQCRIQTAKARQLTKSPPIEMSTEGLKAFHIQNHFEPHPPAEPRPLSKTRLNVQKENKNGDSPDIEVCESSPSKPNNSPNESPRFTYKLPDAKLDKEVSFEDSSKLHVPSVKTYVLHSSQPPHQKDKNIQPAPLTMHNLKLHESLQAIYERRRKRLERHHRNVLGSCRFNLSNSSNESGDSGPSERMWQWLKEATEQSTVPSSEAMDEPCYGDTDFDKPYLPQHMESELIPIYV